jgi:alginate O-acetyltransferase complex protein AlgF
LFNQALNPKMAPLLPCDRLSQRLFGFAVLLLALSIVRPGHGLGQEIGQLYATRPPPGFAFVRIVMASDGYVPRIQVNFLDLLISEATGASSYRAVPGNQPLNLSIDGSAVSKDIVPGAETYLTLVISKTNSDWTLQSIDEAPSSSDGLKARLRFFNLVPGCTAILKIADGPTIFEQGSFASVQSRTINPVTAKLEGSCGEGNALLTLPQLRTGDYYSLFLRKGSERLHLTGQLDEIESYRKR